MTRYIATGDVDMVKKAKGKNPAAVALGSMTSAAKARSSAENGKLGGRPRKTKAAAARRARS